MSMLRKFFMHSLGIIPTGNRGLFPEEWYEKNRHANWPVLLATLRNQAMGGAVIDPRYTVHHIDFTDEEGYDCITCQIFYRAPKRRN